MIRYGLRETLICQEGSKTVVRYKIILERSMKRDLVGVSLRRGSIKTSRKQNHHHHLNARERSFFERDLRFFVNRMGEHVQWNIK